MPGWRGFKSRRDKKKSKKGKFPKEGLGRRILHVLSDLTSCLGRNPSRKQTDQNDPSMDLEMGVRNTVICPQPSPGCDNLQMASATNDSVFVSPPSNPLLTPGRYAAMRKTYSALGQGRFATSQSRVSRGDGYSESRLFFSDGDKNHQMLKRMPHLEEWLKSYGPDGNKVEPVRPLGDTTDNKKSVFLSPVCDPVPIFTASYKQRCQGAAQPWGAFSEALWQKSHIQSDKDFRAFGIPRSVQSLCSSTEYGYQGQISADHIEVQIGSNKAKEKHGKLHRYPSLCGSLGCGEMNPASGIKPGKLHAYTSSSDCHKVSPIDGTELKGNSNGQSIWSLLESVSKYSPQRAPGFSPAKIHPESSLHVSEGEYIPDSISLGSVYEDYSRTSPRRQTVEDSSSTEKSSGLFGMSDVDLYLLADCERDESDFPNEWFHVTKSLAKNTKADPARPNLPVPDTFLPKKMGDALLSKITSSVLELPCIPKVVDGNELKYKYTDESVVKLGIGCFGAVYLATLGQGKLVAIKCFSSARQTLEDVVVEAALATLASETSAVPYCHGVVALRGDSKILPLGLVTDFFGDEDLKESCTFGDFIWCYPQAQRLGIPVPPLSEVIQWAISLTKVLAALHAKGLVIVDLKSDNVLVKEDENNNWEFRLIDLGLAVQAGHNFGEYISMDTAADEHLEEFEEKYPAVAPERFLNGTASFAMDVYSLGYLFNMIGGKTGLEDSMEDLVTMCRTRFPQNRTTLDQALNILFFMRDYLLENGH